MKYLKRVIILWLFLPASMAFAQQSSPDQISFLQGLILPAMVAVVGFLGKSFYELYLEGRKKRIQNMEDKLRHFYWPVLIRLEKDNAIWETILSKRHDQNTIQYKIADNVERNTILANHQEILDIINNYVYLAEPDEALTEAIKEYIKNVTIYKALRDAGEEQMFPLELGAPWPEGLFPIIKERTSFYQNKLNQSPV
ncbi:MAG TPA: hypothetical protein VKZ51_12245 [Cyclobacteriaceae bacterium]|nr:hypothetical protein [Cyclobacteriaceae bacterium]